MTAHEANDPGSALLEQMLAPPPLAACQKILCIQPHPDDNEIGAGGVIALLTAGGAAVDYLTVTDGSLGDNGLTDGARALSAVRAEETLRAGRLLGVRDFYLLNHPDGTLSDIPALAGELAEHIRRGGYDAVLCPDPWSPYEGHWDHIVTGWAAAQAAVCCSLARYPRGTETPPARLRAVGFYFTAKPNTVLDITEYFDLKMQSICAHRSQIAAETAAMYAAYFQWRGRRLTGSGRVGEGLKVLSPLHLHCVPEAAEI